jgi:hypothetical protein
VQPLREESPPVRAALARECVALVAATKERMAEWFVGGQPVSTVLFPLAFSLPQAERSSAPRARVASAIFVREGSRGRSAEELAQLVQALGAFVESAAQASSREWETPSALAI